MSLRSKGALLVFSFSSLDPAVWLNQIPSRKEAGQMRATLPAGHRPPSAPHKGLQYIQIIASTESPQAAWSVRTQGGQSKAGLGELSEWPSDAQRC